jgi:hypothetical protein
MITEVIKVVTDTGDSEKKVKSLGNSISEVGEKGKEAGATGSKGFSNLGGSIQGLTPGLDKAIGGMKGLLVQMYLIVANPIGAVLALIVGAVALLGKAFLSTESGGNKLQKGLSVISGLFSGLLKVLEPVATFLVDNIIKSFQTAGNVILATSVLLQKGLQALGLDSAANGLKVLTNAVDNNVKASGKLADAEAKLVKARRDSEKIQFDFQNKAEKIRQKRDNTSNLSITERARLNAKLAAVLKEQSTEELKIANLAKKVSDLRIAQEGKSSANLDERAASLLKISDINERISGQESEQLANANSLRNEQKALDKEAAETKAAAAKVIEDARLALIKEGFDKETALRIGNQDLLDKTEEQKLKTQKERAEQEIKDLEKKGIDTAAITILNAEKFATLENELIEKRRLEKEEKTKVDNEKIAADKKIQDEKELVFAKEQADKLLSVEQAYQDAKKNALDVGLNILGGFAGKNKALALAILGVQKGLAISDIVINATKSVATQTASAKANIAATNAFYALGGAVGAGIAAKQNIKTLASLAKGIVTTKISAGVGIAGIVAAGITGAKSITGGGGGGSETGSSSGGSAPSFNLVQGTGANQIASSISGQNRPIQAFVVSSNVTTAQSLDRNIISNSKI